MTIQIQSAIPAELTADEQALIKRADAWFDAHREEFIADLLEWVAVPSVSEAHKAAPGEPFGPDVQRIFDVVLARAKALGFDTQTHDGYAISVLSGSGEEEIGLVSHLDVVPAGENWDYDPYKPFERDGFVVGRGAADNKGAALLDLYLLRFFADEGLSFRHKLRVIYGGAEETGMADLAYYAKHAPVPKFSIITDGGFPVNFAQKGNLNARITFPAGPVLSAFKAGVAENAVPAQAEIALPGQSIEAVRDSVAALPDALREVLTLREEGGRAVLRARGISGHAAFPEKTQNAIPLLARALIEAKLVDGLDLAAANFLALALDTPWGDGAGTAREDEISGKLTQNGGIVEPSGDGFLDLHLDIRYPVTVDHEDLLAALSDLAGQVSGTVSVVRHAGPVHFDRDSEQVKLLQATFAATTGLQTEPFSMGGGTHARVLPNSITFGPGFSRNIDQPIDGFDTRRRPDFIREGSGTPHGPDEFVVIDNLRLALRVYAVTLPRLDQWLANDQR